MGRDDERHFIENALYSDLNAYFKYSVKGKSLNGNSEIIRGAGYTDERGRHKSYLKQREGDKIGCLELDTTDLGDSFKLLLRLEKIPSNKGIKGFKIFPGWYLGTTHHIEHQARGNKLVVVVHYEGGISNTSDKDHVDPKIEHPDTSLDFDW